MQKEEKTYKQAEKMCKPSFRYTQHQKAGQNTQQALICAFLIQIHKRSAL